MRVQRLRRRWLQQLQQWANCGELLQAAQRALKLEHTPKALQELINRLAAGEQEQLPPIRVLSEKAIRGAAGAYAKTTQTIYLNRHWLNKVSNDAVITVLTAEFGHHLDAKLNAADTPGDEGNRFASLLLKNSQKQPFIRKLGEQEHGLIFVNNQWIEAEFENWTGNTGGDNYPNAVDGDDNSSDDSLTGNSGNDTIHGGAGNDTIRGKNGHDSIDGGDGNDFLEGGNGAKHNDQDTINGGNGNDTIYGHTSTDIQGGKTPDSIDGGAGNDTIIADRKNDTLVGGTGDDSIQGNWGADKIWGDDKNQDNGVLDGNDTLVGGNQNDTIYGGGGQDSINGGSGNDNLVGQSGNDTIDGGSGTDIAFFNGNRSDYTLTYSNPSGALNSNSITVNGTDGTDVITNIETLRFDDQDLNSVDRTSGLTAWSILSRTPTLEINGSGVETTSLQTNEAATLGSTLANGKRLIIPESWVDNQIFPTLGSNHNKFFIGIPKESGIGDPSNNANWSEVDLHRDFDAVIRISKVSGKYQFDGGRGDNRSTLYPWGDGTKFVDAAAHPYSYAIDIKNGAITILGHSDLNYLKTATSDRTFNFSASWGSFSADGGTVPASLVIGAKNDGGGVMTLSFQLSDLEIVDSPDAPTIAITDDDGDNSLSTGDTSTLTFTLSKASSDFVQSDVTVSGGTLSNWNAASATSYTATFTPTNNSTANGVISIADGTFSDAAFQLESAPPETETSD